MFASVCVCRFNRRIDKCILQSARKDNDYYIKHLKCRAAEHSAAKSVEITIYIKETCKLKMEQVGEKESEKCAPRRMVGWMDGDEFGYIG